MPTVASTDGVTLAVHDLGGDGPPLLLSHATGFHAMVWKPLAAALGHRFHCWAVDYRGHGDASSPADAVAWEGYGEDALAVVHDLGLRGALAIGHSMGGAALLMAEIAETGTFRGIVAYEPIVFPPVPEDDGLDGGQSERPSLAGGARKRRAVFGSKQAAYDNFASKPPLDVFTPEALRAYVDHGFADTPDGRVRLKCDPEHEARTYEMGPRHHTFEHLGRVRCPVLVIGGNPDGNPPGPSPRWWRNTCRVPGSCCSANSVTSVRCRTPSVLAALVEAFADELDVGAGLTRRRTRPAGCSAGCSAGHGGGHLPHEHLGPAGSGGEPG